jgi:hypothetical protein
MLRDTDYLKMANEYSTSIGMATWINFEAKGDMLRKGRGDEATINELVAISIEEGIYPTFIKKVYELQTGRRGKVKDSTIYKRAYQLCK